MKHQAIIIGIAALAFAGCQKPTAEQDTPAEPAPAAPSAPTAPAASTVPATVATVATVPAATPAPELAPPGIFYLLTAVRVETNSGVTGLPPGTGVKFLHDGIYQSDVGEVALRPDQITNNLAAARQARDADRLRQTTIRSDNAAQATMVKAAAAAKGTENAAQHQQALAEIDRQHLDAQRARLTADQQRLDAQLKVLRTRLSKESYDHVYKGRSVTSTTASEIKAVEAAIQALREQINALR